MSARLDSLVAATRNRLAERIAERPQAELEGALDEAPARRGFLDALRAEGMSLIAEHKRRSPSAGTIRAGASVAEIVTAYQRGGASALSILTEFDHFGGSLADLAEARTHSSLPILRKDFAVDPYQLYEARIWGADAVLLVVGAMPAADLAALARLAREVGLDAIVEVHDERELAVALEAEAELIGVNNRNLEDFTVDIGRTAALFAQIPADTTVISESGILTPAHVSELETVGVDAVLVGEALMRAEDPALALRRLLAPEGRPQQMIDS